MASSSHETGGCSDDPTIQEAWSMFRFLIGLCSSTPSSSSSWYHSARIQRMIEKSGEFATVVESDIAASKVHWSEVNSAMSETEHLGKSNRECFELLKRRRYVREGDQIVFKQHDEEQSSNLFWELMGDNLVVGQKIAEGGQAEIYEADTGDDQLRVVKVFKAGCLLQEIVENQIPPALLHSGWNLDLSFISHATLLKDRRFLDRFAFLMDKAWGDLRKLIDEQMIQSGNQCPPFPPKQVWGLMRYIVLGMNHLHHQNPSILHNDLKAANVLVRLDAKTGGPAFIQNGMHAVYVADFECSVGVVGTGFWRAPEILQQLKNKVTTKWYSQTSAMYIVLV